MSFSELAVKAQVDRTIEALKARGIEAELLEKKEDALARLKALIPPNASVSSGASITLKQIGWEDFVKSGGHPWHDLKGEYLAEKDRAKQMEMRRNTVLADFWLGSVHAIAETGELVIASMSGSQLAPYAYAARNIIWVAGAQKIVPTLADALKRVREYVLPLEDVHMKTESGGAMGSLIGKILIFEREVPFLKRKLRMLLVDEVLGF